MSRQKQPRKPASSKGKKPSSQMSAKRSKPSKGNTPGSRHSQAIEMPQAKHSGPRDNRLGSKKPIPLTKAAEKPTQPKFFSPKAELQDIEQDPRLNALLDRLDDGQSLSADDQQYFDKRMARHKTLCELLGIDAEPEEETDGEEEGDLLDKLNTNHLDDYR